MKVATGIIIFFLSLLALVAEFILYFVFGLGAAFSGGLRTVTGLAFFFVSLMVLTAATGILAPICAVLEMALKKKNISYYIMLPILGLIVVGLGIFSLFGTNAVREAVSRQNQRKLPGAREGKSGTNSMGTEKEIAYLKFVEIRNLEVGKSVLDEVGVFGEVKNLGDKSLKEVEIKIYFLDKSSQPVFEKAYHPVLVSDFSFGRDANQPLKPGYSRKFGVKADDVPSDWARRIKAEVVGVKIQE